MLEIKNLNYSVTENGEKKKILKNVNLKFEDNKIYVITGPNGSGKSTLSKLIMGILAAQSGKIILDNKDISSLTIDQRANEGMTFAFQKPCTFKGIKVGQLLDIASGKKNNVGSSCEYLSMVGLCAKDYINRPVDNSLSGGELKRIEIAMALAKGGKVNIFDEPEAGIDIWSFSKLTDIFSSINGTSIIVSHQKKILEIADQVILLVDGKVEKVGSYQEIEPLLDQKRCKKLAGGENE